jgi:hypothetical protein
MIASPLRKSGEHLVNRAARQDDLLEEAVAAFRAALPQLLRQHKHRWVLYRGATRVAVATSQWELFDECERRGWNAEECLIQPVLEEPDPLDPEAVQGK